jgi:predicted nucleotidyltransferase
MNTIRDDLPKKVKEYFYKLQDYLDTQLYFYGSVTRSDYIHGKSDIDLAIFSDNEYSTISKLQHYLHVKRNNFEKVVWKLNGQMIYGFKVKCGEDIGLNCEIAIYNNIFKYTLLKEFDRPNDNQPIYVFVLLYILKLFYYRIPLLSKNTYTRIKRYIMNELMGQKESAFFVVKDDLV